VKLFKGLLLGGAVAAVPLMFVANAATAAPATVKAVTHLDDRPDTCACVTGVSSTNGDVWAYDNLSRQFTVTPLGGQSYRVDITDNGRFSAIAEPDSADLSTAHPINANGSVKGTNTYFVTSTEAPDPSSLPSHVGPDVSTSSMIQDYLFAGHGTITGYGDYTYTYRAGGETYAQSYSQATGSVITGDITGK
jgi:hypothetical protein